MEITEPGLKDCLAETLCFLLVRIWSIHFGLVGNLKQVGDFNRPYNPLFSINEFNMLLVTSI